MEVNVKERHCHLSERSREQIERRIRFAFDRFNDKIRHVDVVVDDENGPRGGSDKRCTVHVKMDRWEDVFTSALAEDPVKAASLSADRAVRRIVKIKDQFEH
jgi:ribosome-associated translation inhibitor RaiA